MTDLFVMSSPTFFYRNGFLRSQISSLQQTNFQVSHFHSLSMMRFCKTPLAIFHSNNHNRINNTSLSRLQCNKEENSIVQESSLSSDTLHSINPDENFNSSNAEAEGDILSSAPLTSTTSIPPLRVSLGEEKKKKTTAKDISKFLSQLLPFVVLLSAGIALIYPPSFLWFNKKHYAPALGGIMLSIGIQLSVSDFLFVLKNPIPVFIGCISHYALKPLMAIITIALCNVPQHYAVGLLLVASVSGAQLSSYASYLANADVALNIILTALTTIFSVFMTPMLTKFLIGSIVPIDLMAMAYSILQVVIFPVALGLILNTYAKKMVEWILPVLPLLAMAGTSLCIGSPLAINRNILLSPQGTALLFPILFFHIISFLLGYFFAILPFWNQEKKTARSLSLFTGMQSSALAMLLASQFFEMSQTVPPACSVVIMSLLGLCLGSFWGNEAELNSKLV